MPKCIILSEETINLDIAADKAYDNYKYYNDLGNYSRALRELNRTHQLKAEYYIAKAREEDKDQA